MQGTWCSDKVPEPGWNPGRPSEVKPGRLWSPFPLASPSCWGGQGPCGPGSERPWEAGCLCSVPGVAGRVVALWQPWERRQPSAGHGLHSPLL